MNESSDESPMKRMKQLKIHSSTIALSHKHHHHRRRHLHLTSIEKKKVDEIN
jgi:hypothetical protein